MKKRMKKLLTFVLIAAIALPAILLFPNIGSAADNFTRVYYHRDFDEGRGFSLTDGLVHSAGTITTGAGRSGNGLYLKGGGSEFYIKPDAGDFGDADIVLQLDIKLDSESVATNGSLIMLRMAGASKHNEILTQTVKSGTEGGFIGIGTKDYTKVTVSAFGTELYSGKTVKGTDSAPADVWHTLRYEINTKTKKATVYVDGTKKVDSKSIELDGDYIERVNFCIQSGTPSSQIMKLDNIYLYSGAAKSVNDNGIGETKISAMYGHMIDPAFYAGFNSPYIFKTGNKTVWQSGSTARTAEAAPVNDNGLFYMPLKALAELAGYTVTQNGDEISVIKGGTRLLFNAATDTVLSFGEKSDNGDTSVISYGAGGTTVAAAAQTMRGYSEVSHTRPLRTVEGGVLISCEDAQTLLGVSLNTDSMGIITMKTGGEVYFTRGRIGIDAMAEYIRTLVFPEVADESNATVEAAGEGVIADMKAKWGNDLTATSAHPRLQATKSDFDKLRAVYTADETSENRELKSYVTYLVTRANNYLSNTSKFTRNTNGTYTVIKSAFAQPIGKTYSSHGMMYDDGYDIGGRSYISDFTSQLKYLAFAYQITGEEFYADAAAQVITELGGWMHWGDGHFLNNADAAVVIATTYDWIYSALTTEQRANFAQMLYEKTIFPAYIQFMERKPVNWSARASGGYSMRYRTNNWGTVCTSGVMTAALAIAGYDVDYSTTVPAYAVKAVHCQQSTTTKTGEYTVGTTPGLMYFTVSGGKITSMQRNTDSMQTGVERTIGWIFRSVPYCLDVYAPDGSYIESPSYWVYGTNTFFVMIENLVSATGSDYGFMSTPGLDGTCRFALNLESSDQRAWNYHDGHYSVIETCHFSFAGKWYGHDDLIALRYKQIYDGKGIAFEDVIYYNSDYRYVGGGVNGGLRDLDSLGKDHYAEGIDTFVTRSSWYKGAIFTGLHTGKNNLTSNVATAVGYHGNIDSGNFIIQKDGQEWIADLGTDNYNLYNYYGNERYYRLSAEGANTIVMPGLFKFGQNINGRAHIESNFSSFYGSYAVSDTSDLFRGNNGYGINKISGIDDNETKSAGYVNAVSSAKRGILFTNGRRTVVIQDEISLSEATELYWFAHTRIVKASDIIISEDGRTAYISKDGVILRASLVSDDASLRFTAMNAGTEDASIVCDGTFNKEEAKQYCQSLNSTKDQVEYDRSGYSKLAIHATNVTSFNVAVVFEFVPAQSANNVGYKFTPISGWSESTINDGKDHLVSLYTDAIAATDDALSARYLESEIRSLLDSDEFKEMHGDDTSLVSNIEAVADAADEHATELINAERDGREPKPAAGKLTDANGKQVYEYPAGYYHINEDFSDSTLDDLQLINNTDGGNATGTITDGYYRMANSRAYTAGDNDLYFNTKSSIPGSHSYVLEFDYKTDAGNALGKLYLRYNGTDAAVCSTNTIMQFADTGVRLMNESSQAVSPAYTAEAGTWMHVGIVINLEALTSTLYVNGRVISQSVIKDCVSLAGNDPKFDGSFTLRFGSNQSKSGASDMSFDNIRLYEGKAPRSTAATTGDYVLTLPNVTSSFRETFDGKTTKLSFANQKVGGAVYNSAGGNKLTDEFLRFSSPASPGNNLYAYAGARFNETWDANLGKSVGSGSYVFEFDIKTEDGVIPRFSINQRYNFKKTDGYADDGGTTLSRLLVGGDGTSFGYCDYSTVTGTANPGITPLPAHAIKVNEWVRISIVLNLSASGNTIDIYIDGAKCVEEIKTKDLLLPTDGNFGLRIGINGNTQAFSGLCFDNIRIYSGTAPYDGEAQLERYLSYAEANGSYTAKADALKQAKAVRTALAGVTDANSPLKVSASVLSDAATRILTVEDKLATANRFLGYMAIVNDGNKSETERLNAAKSASELSPDTSITEVSGEMKNLRAFINERFFPGNIKYNLTLYSDFRINFYIPTDNVTAICLTEGGENIMSTLDTTKIDGKDYYMFTEQVPSDGILTEISFFVTVEKDGVSVTRATCSDIYSYLEYLFEVEGVSDTEKQLAHAILIYANEALSYFDSGVSRKISALAEKYSRYATNSEFPASGDVGNIAAALDYVRLNLGSAPEFMFTSKFGFSGTLTFSYTSIDGNTISRTVTFDGSVKTVTLSEMRAYDFRSLITITGTAADGTAISGSYSLGNYAENKTGSLAKLLTALSNYAEASHALKLEKMNNG